MKIFVISDGCHGEVSVSSAHKTLDSAKKAILEALPEDFTKLAYEDESPQEAVAEWDGSESLELDSGQTGVDYFLVAKPIELED